MFFKIKMLPGNSRKVDPNMELLISEEQLLKMLDVPDLTYLSNEFLEYNGIDSSFGVQPQNVPDEKAAHDFRLNRGLQAKREADEETQALRGKINKEEDTWSSSLAPYSGESESPFAGVADISSLPGRALAAGVESLRYNLNENPNDDVSFKENLKYRSSDKGTTMLGSLVRDPSLPLTLPIGAGIGSKFLRGAGAGANLFRNRAVDESVISMASSFIDDLVQDGEIDKNSKEYIVEILVGSGLGALSEIPDTVLRASAKEKLRERLDATGAFDQFEDRMYKEPGSPVGSRTEAGGYTGVKREQERALEEYKGKGPREAERRRLENALKAAKTSSGGKTTDAVKSAQKDLDDHLALRKGPWEAKKTRLENALKDAKTSSNGKTTGAVMSAQKDLYDHLALRKGPWEAEKTRLENALKDAKTSSGGRRTTAVLSAQLDLDNHLTLGKTAEGKMSFAQGAKASKREKELGAESGVETEFATRGEPGDKTDGADSYGDLKAKIADLIQPAGTMTKDNRILAIELVDDFKERANREIGKLDKEFKSLKERIDAGTAHGVSDENMYVKIKERDYLRDRLRNLREAVRKLSDNSALPEKLAYIQKLKFSAEKLKVAPQPKVDGIKDFAAKVGSILGVPNSQMSLDDLIKSRGKGSTLRGIGVGGLKTGKGIVPQMYDEKE